MHLIDNEYRRNTLMNGCVLRQKKLNQPAMKSKVIIFYTWIKIWYKKNYANW